MEVILLLDALINTEVSLRFFFNFFGMVFADASMIKSKGLVGNGICLVGVAE
jgi:hypothetical protein